MELQTSSVFNCTKLCEDYSIILWFGEFFISHIINVKYPNFEWNPFQTGIIR